MPRDRQLVDPDRPFRLPENPVYGTTGIPKRGARGPLVLLWQSAVE